MKFVNLTPHSIALNDGREFPSEGNARVTDSYTEFDENLTCCVKHGDIVDLPRTQERRHLHRIRDSTHGSQGKGKKRCSGSSHRTPSVQERKRIHRLRARLRQLKTSPKDIIN